MYTWKITYFSSLFPRPYTKVSLSLTNVIILFSLFPYSIQKGMTSAYFSWDVWPKNQLVTTVRVRWDGTFGSKFASYSWVDSLSVGLNRRWVQWRYFLKNIWSIFPNIVIIAQMVKRHTLRFESSRCHAVLGLVISNHGWMVTSDGIQT